MEVIVELCTRVHHSDVLCVECTGADRHMQWFPKVLEIFNTCNDSVKVSKQGMVVCKDGVRTCVGVASFGVI